MLIDWNTSFGMKLFSGKFWRPTAKLSYMILLMHMEVLLYVIWSATNLSYFTMNVVMRDFGAAYLYCIPLALLLHVVHEKPLFVGTAQRRLFLECPACARRSAFTTPGVK
jgi:hypothetical protein